MAARSGKWRGLWGRERGGRGCRTHLTSCVIALAATATASTLAGDGAGGPCYYEVTVLDLIEDCAFGQPGSTRARAIADNGWMTGRYPQCNGSGDGWAMLNTGGTAVQPLIPPFEGVWRAEGQDITSSGLIVGWMDIDGVGQRGFLYDHGASKWLKLPGLPSTTFSEALGVNDSGVAIGRTGNQITGPSPLAIMWVDGEPLDLAAILGTPKSEARDINNSGAITGWHGSSSTANARAFIYDGSVIALDAVPGGTTSEGIAINEQGDVVLFGFVPDPTHGNVRRGFFYRDDEFIPLGILPGYIHVIPQDISEDGAVVGWCQSTESSLNAREAFIWRDGEMIALSQLVDPALNLEFSIAHSINNRGQIVAQATNGVLPISFAVLLTPSHPADLNGDCITNHWDLIILLGDWGAVESPADLDDNGVVNVSDLLFLLGHWG